MAGVGNVLRGDDGFGVVVARTLLAEPVPPEVRVLEIGIGGIHLVQELFDRVDVLVAVDAVDLQRPPGTVVVVRPEVRDVMSLPLLERHDELADMHWATPARAFMLARALGVLPPTLWLVGCQPVDAERLAEGLAPELERAVGAAVAEVKRLVGEAGIAWS